MSLAKLFGAFVVKLGLLTDKTRQELAVEGRALRERLEGLGYPKMWGSVSPEILHDTQAWQQKCADAGLSQAAVYDQLGTDIEHISGTEVLLILDEILLALDPPGSMGG